MIGWWLLGAMLERRSPWTIPNLLATTFYGERAYRQGFIVPTWAGLAGTLVVYCAAGVVFAVAGRERKGGWVLLLVGMTAGLALDWFCFGIVLRRLNPLVQIYSPDRLIEVSHLLYGAALASYPGFARQLQAAVESDLPAVNRLTPNPPPLPAPLPVPPPIPESLGPEQQASEHTASDQEVGGSIP